MGLFYSGYAAVLWPCIPMVVSKKSVGTAFGVTTALQNLGRIFYLLQKINIIRTIRFTTACQPNIWTLSKL
jgi:hypothetical protein